MPMPEAVRLDLDRDGATFLPAALSSAQLTSLEDFAGNLPKTAGVRLTKAPACVFTGAVNTKVRDRLGPNARPVRAILFDKSADTNWSLAWHQDRTIAVRGRRDVAGFGPWTRKQGIHHVEPPFALLARMVTARFHLDPVDADNGPLRVALGSHRLGRVADREAAVVAERHRRLDCYAGRGDVWLYATPILHASDRARRPSHRRVLQVDFSADWLPGGLELLDLCGEPVRGSA